MEISCSGKLIELYYAFYYRTRIYFLHYLAKLLIITTNFSKGCTPIHRGVQGSSAILLARNFQRFEMDSTNRDYPQNTILPFYSNDCD